MVGRHEGRCYVSVEKLCDVPLPPFSKHWSIITNTGPAVFGISNPQLDISPRCFSTGSEGSSANSSRGRNADSCTWKHPRSSGLPLGNISSGQESRWECGQTRFSDTPKFEARRQRLTVRREWPAQRSALMLWQIVPAFQKAACLSGGRAQPERKLVITSLLYYLKTM